MKYPNNLIKIKWLWSHAELYNSLSYLFLRFGSYFEIDLFFRLFFFVMGNFIYHFFCILCRKLAHFGFDCSFIYQILCSYFMNYNGSFSSLIFIIFTILYYLTLFSLSFFIFIIFIFLFSFCSFFFTFTFLTIFFLSLYSFSSLLSFTISFYFWFSFSFLSFLSSLIFKYIILISFIFRFHSF